MVSQRLKHYRVLEKIGAGGMGEVYRAHDDSLDRDVAIKLLPRESFGDPVARARLLREARTASQLNHPNICTIHEVGEADGQPYIGMELVEGRLLSARVATGALPPEEVLRYGLQLSEALAHAHERNVVHRDFKSANVILTLEGRAKVLDFGLAKRVRGEEIAEDGWRWLQVIGKPWKRSIGAMRRAATRARCARRLIWPCAALRAATSRRRGLRASMPSPVKRSSHWTGWTRPMKTATCNWCGS